MLQKPSKRCKTRLNDPRLTGSTIDTGSSNSLRSTTQSAIFAFSEKDSKRVQPEFGALFGPNKKHQCWRDMFALDSALLQSPGSPPFANLAQNLVTSNIRRRFEVSNHLLIGDSQVSQFCLVHSVSPEEQGTIIVAKESPLLAACANSATRGRDIHELFKGWLANFTTVRS
jgi:hypothetical protein